MNIADRTSKRNLIPVLLILVLSASGSFGFGMLAERDLLQKGGAIGIQSVAVTPGFESSSAEASTSLGTPLPSSISSGGEVVGDHTAKTYFLPWCSPVASIASSSLVWFSSEDAAQTDGYTAGKNCPGI